MTSEAIEHGSNGVSYISFLPWKEELFQGTTLRNLYDDPRKPFDLGSDSGSRTGKRLTDWEHFRKSISPVASIVAQMEQVHGNRVETVSRETVREGNRIKGDLFFKGCDGLITDVPNLVLTARVADCVPIFLFDRPRRIIGLLHAGWRGTAAEILSGAVERMKGEYSSVPADIEVYLGPSIERDCYPVKMDVFRKFDRWNEKSRDPGNDWKVDLRDINRQQAMAQGIPEENIVISRYCTACSTDVLYSHRASLGDCGRMAAFAALRKSFFP
jgi:YfiH family protein